MFWFSSKYKIYAYTEKAFNENNHSFMIKKTLQKVGMEKIYFKITKAIQTHS